MKKLELPDYDVWISPDMSADLENIDRTIRSDVTDMASNLDPLEEQYVALYARHIKRPRSACLMSHGDNDGTTWLYWDGNSKRHVQSWIDSCDGQYGLLVLCVCNTASLTPRSKTSLLLVPDQSFELSQLNGSKGSLPAVHLSLIHPTEGELEHTIEYELKKLKREMKSAAG